MKFNNLKFLSLIFTLALVSCNKVEQEAEIAPGDDLKLIENVKFDYDHAFFDDFTDGVKKENWFIGDQAWGGNNGGVVPENVSYTDDGVLLLRGNGGHYQQNEIKGVGDVKDGCYTGAALISNFLVGPGRYEIKMKVLPRLGACTAFWTYAYEYDNELNHEIDIELPGGNRSGNITYENVLNTNYTKVSEAYSQDINVASKFGNDVYLNDGEWHTFGFDWYTNPEKIVYHLDGKVTTTSDLFVPSMLCRLWVGVWFPVSSGFVGSANFETDYMQVDYIEYIPFLDQPFIDFNPSPNGYANENEYPTIPQNEREINKISNGTFEYLNSENINNGGWNLKRYLYEEKEVNEVCYVEEGIGIEESKGLVIKDGGVVEQTIDAVYSNFKHKLEFNAKGKGTVTIRYYSKDTTTPLDTKVINIDSESYKLYTLDLTAPKNSQTLRFTIDTVKGPTNAFDGEATVNFDNFSLYQKKGVLA